ncbi:MAG: hypothetical protein IK128_06830 [Clostridiales bacterium]|nr:hypothetical protein [Clostridiales bacterium]
MKLKYCDSYLMLQLLSLKAELAGLPNVKIGTLRGRTVARVYSKNPDGRIIYRTYFADTSDGQKYCGMAGRRFEIKKEIKSLENLIGKRIANLMDNCKITLNGTILNDDLWFVLGNDENPRAKNGNYYHNGIQMRSRGEVLIAEILDELKLEYKYEPGLQFGRDVVYPDFLVHIACLKRCMIIEFFGMSDNEKYAFDTLNKMTLYAGNGLLMNRDILGLFGTKDTMVSNEDIYNNIVMILNLQALEAVQLK